jgi:ribonuclease III
MERPDLSNPGQEIIEDFARRLNLPFTNYLLLSRSLTHRSYINEHPEAIEDNERLEFLGDAVLDFLVGDWLYNHFPEMAEGELTRLRSALVRTEQLSDFAISINLGSVLRLGHGEEEGGGRLRPALLCGAFEALVGALYLNAGLEAVYAFMVPLISDAVQSILNERRDHDPKSLLQEWVQSQGFGPPIYRIVGTSGPEHEKLFEAQVVVDENVYGSGSGHSKQLAAKAAARNALDSLGIR